MKLQNDLRNHPVLLQSTEQNNQHTSVNLHSKSEELAPNKSATTAGDIQPKRDDFNALLAVEEFDISNITPQEFTSLIADITHLSSETGKIDDSTIEGLSHFRVSLEVRMATGQLNPNAKLDMQQYVNDYTKQSENLSKQDDKTYAYSPIYANQSKQAIDTIFTQSNLENLQLEAIDFLKKSGSILIDKEV
ncbi:hypothetical protein PCIT_a1168 [Pseudoalteromonas citrea]|uniref:Uncharacterized protein n=2 Tax=Pseudoalteromonas citrea TaxID=43655 RepID=A0AAD4ALZ0_9GAMM|nr:hypothetical protein [Pseudoalteromonas citrea]KAF7775069.1 hypothetical protein PCIT_a1168 [Pseudoalteromonas citrea]